MPECKHDPQADAVYIRLHDLPCQHGEDLDDSRRIDYGADEQPTGIELLDVGLGVNLDGLPKRTEVKKLLVEHQIKIAASASGSQS